MPRVSFFPEGGGEAGDGRRPALVSPPPSASADEPGRARRRTFTGREKLRILEDVDAAPPGGVGAVLRREGLYSSLLAEWRRQRAAGAYAALTPVKRGPKAAETNPWPPSTRNSCARTSG